VSDDPTVSGGQERRTDSLRNAILLEVKELLEEHEKREEDTVKEINKKLDDVVTVMIKIEGVLLFVKSIFVYVAPLIAGLAWVYDHLTLPS
jgi:hypothetical protein